jgi:hypothetical protein
MFCASLLSPNFWSRSIWQWIFASPSPCIVEKVLHKLQQLRTTHDFHDYVEGICHHNLCYVLMIHAWRAVFIIKRDGCWDSRGSATFRTPWISDFAVISGSRWCAVYRLSINALS